ncbi:T9SS type A sorting domain-containing protein [Flavitalea antarctica]
MKENIYITGNSHNSPLVSVLFVTGSLLISLVSSAQQPGAFNTRNINTHNNNNGRLNTSGNTQKTLKTLSVLPGVTPYENTSGTRYNEGANAPRSTSHYQNGGSHSGVNVYFDGITNTGNLLLSNTPAKLSSFAGNSENGQYRLTWEVVMENEVAQYNVEYSTNDRDFQSAGTVKASNRAAYTFNHIADAQTNMYYRLKVIDTRGAASYTNSIIVRSGLAKPADLVTPTIIRDGVLNITLANAYKDVQLFNGEGVMVFREYIGGRTGNRIGFNLPDLPAGAYFVRLTGTNTIVTQKVMII